MAKVSIVFEDKEDGLCEISVVFEPPVSQDEELTDAQFSALFAVEKLEKIMEEGS